MRKSGIGLLSPTVALCYVRKDTCPSDVEDKGIQQLFAMTLTRHMGAVKVHGDVSTASSLGTKESPRNPVAAARINNCFQHGINNI